MSYATKQLTPIIINGVNCFTLELNFNPLMFLFF